MILNLLFSMKGLSLTSMLFMIAINPQNAIKISFSHFAFNLSMALVSFIFPFYMKTLIEVSLPYKGSLVGVFFFTFFKNVPKPILITYEWLVYLIQAILHSTIISRDFSYIDQKNKIISMNQPPQTFESGLFELWTSIMQWQKRGSQYLTSFILGNGGYNIDGFSESMLNATGFITTFKIVVLFMTLPMTYQEWPWIEKGNQNDQQNQQNQVNLQNSAQPQQQQQRSIQEAEEYNARLAHASTYLMNALFVLMTTNYTVNPQLYYLGDGATDKNSSFMIYFPLAQIVIGILYTVEKVMSSSD
eukprot:403335416